MRLACIVMVWGGCYSPSPPVGLACGVMLACPAGQRCASAICVVDDTADARPSSNDTPAGAIDVSGGGSFPFDLSAAADDFDAPCGGAGSDVFFAIDLAADEVIYFDTLDANFDSVIAILAGPCTAPGAMEACVNDSCGGDDAQGAWNLGAGTHCIVVDAVGTGGSGTLVVVRGGHAGEELTGTAGSVTGDSCSGDDSNEPLCGCGPSRDDHWFFVACPDPMFRADVDTCTSPMFDAVLEIRNATGESLTCEDSDGCGPGSESISAPITNPGLYWVIVDGCSECGPYTLTYDF